MRRTVLALAPLLLAASAGPLLAQHTFSSGGAYDPAVPTPRSVLGYDIGDRFTPHYLVARYLARLAATSRRIRLDTVAHSFEGREVFLVIATSEANQARLDAIRADAARLADPRGASPAGLAATVARTPAIVWLGYTVHGNEASGVEAGLAIAYQLAAGRDPETQMVLDSTVVLIDPVENPDGHERHVQDVMRARGAGGAEDVPPVQGAMVHQGSWPGARGNHYDFDMNRDWFILSQPETRGRVAAFQRWWPHVAVDLHEMGADQSYYFAPPMDPINKNVPESIRRWWDIFAAGNAAAFDAHGWAFFRREDFDEFYPSYGDSWPILNGAIGMTYEEASSQGGAIRKSDGTLLTLRDATWHHYTASWATLVTAAKRARERVSDYLAFRQSAVTDGETGPVRTVAVAPDEQGRADSLVAHLLANGIAVSRLRSLADVRDAVAYGESAPRPVRLAAGTYVVDLAQPQGRLAKALLEPDAQLDSSFIAQELERRRTGQSDRFYDMTAWALPYVFRVHAWWSHGPVGPADPVDTASLAAARPASFPGSAPQFAYAFSAGSETSLRLLGALLADSVRVSFASRTFTQAGVRFPNGTFLVRVAANGPQVGETVARRAAETGARVVALHSAGTDSGPDLGGNTVFPVRAPRVALIGGPPVSGNSFGFAWFAFNQRLHYPVVTVNAASLGGLDLGSFDVIVVPSAGAGAFDRVLGEGGKERLVQWVKDGGTLITLDGATSWLAAEKTGLARLRLRRDTTRADSAGGAPLPAYVPGAIVRLQGDTLSPLLAGIGETEIPALDFSDRIYNPPKDLAPGEAVLRYAPAQRLRIAGYLWPEVPARLAESVYLWTERDGRGRVIGFAGDPNFRDLWRSLLPLFANAVFLGPVM
ncbi:MAG TPA: M14 family zinc carboxypeptidase [Gemmatimonadales bacterium]|nr:M14 family zinc carboxypeptidase [Gemmatimonadales bacterium]